MQGVSTAITGNCFILIAEITDLAELESDIMADTEGPMTGEPMTGEPMTGEPMTEGPMTEGPMTEGPESMTKPPGNSCND